MAVPFIERVPVGSALILLRGVGEWEELALHLGISDSEIKLVRRLVGTIDTKMMVLLSRWVQSDPKATWEKLGKALLKMNPPYVDKAALIRKHFCPNLQLQQLGFERKRTYESTEHSEISQPKKKHKGSSSSEGTCHSSVDLSATSHTSHVQPMSLPPLDNIRRSFSNTIQATHLKLIKWTERGETKRFYLMEKIENKWRDIGQLTGLSLTQLESIATEHRDKPIECCRTVLGRWMDNPPKEYPTTWDGLIELLEDCQLTHVAEELKIVLSKANLT